ncbi:unnamed protein product [marine sediment metagenome]|uniref:Uncharacterized protein n=1 Tax=marine sediment metagenome TaxID=412755 RepID=X0U2X4_9ZZZZ
MEPCLQENTVKRLDKAIFGNGQRGIIKEFEQFKTEHKEMKGDLGKLATAFSALVQINSNKEAIRKVLGAALGKVALIVGVSGTVITLLIKLL